MFYHYLDPVFFQLGPFTVRYYGIIFAAGILLSFLIIRHLAMKRKLPLSSRDFDVLLLGGTFSVVAGARLGSVISAWSYYSANPSQIIAVWNGGLAFHGGLIGLVLFGLWFAKSRKIPFYDLADIAVIPIALALAFGRVANFINGEFYGTITGLPWGVKFQGAEGFRHPVQIYESIKNLLIFAVLWQLQGRSLPKGTLFWAFIFLYGSLRFLLEFMKDVQEYAFGLTWGQFWSIPMFAVGGFMVWRLVRNGKKA